MQGKTIFIPSVAVIHENFFIGSICLEGFLCHEVAMYYLMKPRGTQEFHSDSCTSDGLKKEMHWIPIEDLDKHKLFPTFLKEYLENPQDEIVHIVTDERE